MANNASAQHTAERVGKVLDDFEAVELEPKTPNANRTRFAGDPVVQAKKTAPGPNSDLSGYGPSERAAAANNPVDPRSLARILVSQQQSNAQGYKVFRRLSLTLVFWLFAATGAMIFAGFQYFSETLPAMRDTYLTYGVAERVKSDVRTFLSANLFGVIDQLHHNMQLGVYKNVLHFRQLELIVSPTMMANPAIYMLQLGFDGPSRKTKITQGGVVFRRVGPYNHVILQSDLYPACVAIGIFGCVRNTTVATQPWFTNLRSSTTAAGLAPIIIEPKIDVEQPPPPVIPVIGIVGDEDIGGGEDDGAMDTGTTSVNISAMEFDSAGTNYTGFTASVDYLFMDFSNVTNVTNASDAIFKNDTLDMNLTLVDDTMSMEYTLGDVPRLTPEEMGQEAKRVKTYLHEQDVQRKYFYRWSADHFYESSLRDDGPQLQKEKEKMLPEFVSRLDTQLSLDSNIFFFSPAISLEFKLEFPLTTALRDELVAAEKSSQLTG
jgi:hypothetical protein